MPTQLHHTYNRQKNGILKTTIGMNSTNNFNGNTRNTLMKIQYLSAKARFVKKEAIFSCRVIL